MEANLLGIPVSIVRPGAVDTGVLDASTKALERFMAKTELYKCNALPARLQVFAIGFILKG